MITEKDLLKWGFENTGISGRCYEIIIEKHPALFDLVFFDFRENRLVACYNRSQVELFGVTTKRKADQALHLLGLPPIDKLKEIKK